MRNIILGLGMLLTTISALGSTGTGKIIGLSPYMVSGEEILFVKLESTPSDTPPCNWTGRYVIGSAGNPHFKYTQSVILAAFMAGTPVRINGNNTCNKYDNSETFTYVCIGNTPC